MSVLHRRSLVAGLGAVTLAAPAVVRAQDPWPKGPIRVVVPFPPLASMSSQVPTKFAMVIGVAAGAAGCATGLGVEAGAGASFLA